MDKKTSVSLEQWQIRFVMGAFEELMHWHEYEEGSDELAFIREMNELLDEPILLSADERLMHGPWEELKPFPGRPAVELPGPQWYDGFVPHKPD